MKVKELGLEGLFLIMPDVFYDNRGYLYESYNSKRWSSSDFPDNFVQDNIAYNKLKNTIRGMHYQEKYHQAKLVSCVRGSILDVAVDVRKDSKTYGKWASVELSADNKNQLWIPKGFAHGYRTLEDDTSVLYKTDEYYIPDDYRGFAWDDVNINIEWGVVSADDSVILSQKDTEYGAFEFET
tara:strand:+ start:431 stop:976 length:546 start_codon:yes stop_codon:yes gene_type:complete